MAGPTLFPYRNQPWKSIYMSVVIISLLLRIPYWSIKFLFPAIRQIRSWSWRRSIIVTALQCAQGSFTNIGKMSWPDYKAIDPGSKALGFWITPAPDLIHGQVKEWADLADVEPICIPGYWYHHPEHDTEVGASARKDEKVILHLHSGAYIMGTAHPSGASSATVLGTGLLQYTTTIRRALAVEYRLSSTAPYEAVNPFPAALLDAIAGYNHLINGLGFSPTNVFVMGDSAGGHLALSLARYTMENKDVLPPPGGLILCYPMTDFTASHNTPTSSAIRYDGIDIMSPMFEEFVQYCKNAFLGPNSPERNPYLSPGSADPMMDSIVTFKGFPRTFICVGMVDKLLDQIRIARDRMVRDIGEDMVQYEEVPDTVHGFLSFSWHEPERSHIFKKIDQWMTRR